MNASRLLLSVLACFAVLSHPVHARSPVQSNPAQSFPDAPTVDATQGTEAVSAFGPKKLLDTYMAIGFNTILLTGGAYNTVDTSLVTCPTSAVTCTIGLESMAQINFSGGDWEICLKVDGVAPSCQYQGGQPSTTGLLVGNARGARQNLAPGSHTVQTQIFVQFSANLYFFHTDYRVYKQ